jgi:hypothetical protein|tara:strand:- start:12072 stop:13211 length:1140 start_codon:yes stop_codon:yes gene_type:complete
MDNNDELEMGLFGGDSDLELNFDVNPEDIAGFGKPPVDDNIQNPPAPDADDKTQPGDNPDDINSTEDIDPESVSGDEDPEGGDDAISPNLFSSFASELHSKGVLPSLDLDTAKIEDTEGLATVIKGEIDAQAKNYIISKIGEDGYDALEKGISLAQYQQHTNTVDTLNSITDEGLAEDLDLAKRVILQDYINQGLTEVRAKRILQKTIDLGEEAVLEDAKESITSLKVYEENRIQSEKVAATQRNADAVQAQEKIDNDLKSAIYTKKSIIEGMTINKTIQDKVYKSITQVVGESPDGVMENKLMQDRRENPIEFDSKLYYLYEITKGFSDFSTITTKASSKAASDFEKALRQTKFEGSGSPGFTQDRDSYDGLGTELVL